MLSRDFFFFFLKVLLVLILLFEGVYPIYNRVTWNPDKIFIRILVKFDNKKRNPNTISLFFFDITRHTKKKKKKSFFDTLSLQKKNIIMLTLSPSKEKYNYVSIYCDAYIRVVMDGSYQNKNFKRVFCFFKYIYIYVQWCIWFEYVILLINEIDRNVGEPEQEEKKNILKSQKYPPQGDSLSFAF